MHDAGLDSLPPFEIERAVRLRERFEQCAGRRPDFLVRAPGRVNLLGEHTDYNGLPVLPMAIERSILIAGAAQSGRAVQLQNTAPAYGPRRYELAAPLAPFSAGDWGNYAKAATLGIMGACGADLSRGADLLVDGNIPAGAGLSSSSALVVAVALALLAANAVAVPPTVLAELLPAAERYVGTLSGGMDQAVSLLAQADRALRIDFFPLRVHPVPLPVGYRIIVCHSLVRAEKSAAARHAYNLRVIECRLVARAMERLLGDRLPRGLRRLGDLTTLFPGRPLLDFLALLTARVPERPLHLEEVAALIGTSAARLREECGVGDLGDAFTLVRRARHVLSEAERVEQAMGALAAGDAPAFGLLMDASHASCRDDYEISCADLEALVAMAKEAGALGARLTGAGFGGCTVNLVPAADVGAFLTHVQRGFYGSRAGAAGMPAECRFVFSPQRGAQVLRL